MIFELTRLPFSCRPQEFSSVTRILFYLSAVVNDVLRFLGWRRGSRAVSTLGDL
jgi:hypothetical protein